jgi:hypothetical protein
MKKISFSRVNKLIDYKEYGEYTNIFHDYDEGYSDYLKLLNHIQQKKTYSNLINFFFISIFSHSIYFSSEYIHNIKYIFN